MNFIQNYLEHTKEYESPKSFWKWSAYGAISSVLRNNIFFKVGDRKIFPNIYILFLAQSSYDRKGPPIEFAESLTRYVGNTKIISGRASIQGILHELSLSETDKKTGKITKGGAATFFAPELSAGVVSDPQAIGILTDIYDPKEQYETILKTQTKVSINNLVFTMISGSNADMLAKLFDVSAIRGGLLARTFLITPDEFRPANSLMNVEDKTESRQCLKDGLKQISELNGIIDITADGSQEYNKWYIPFREGQKNKKDKSGAVGRIHTGVLKLAFIIAASKLSLVVRRQEIEESIEECMKLLKNYNFLTQSVGGRSSLKDIGPIFLTELYHAEHNTMSRKTIISKHWEDIDAESLDKLCITLEQGGLIQQVMNGASSISYRLTPHGLALMSGHDVKG